MIIDLGKGFEIIIVKNGKYKFQFISLSFEKSIIINEWLQLVDLVECLLSYQRNQLDITKRYTVCNLIELELYKKEREVLLALYIGEQWVYFDKLKAAQMANKINRTLNACDLFSIVNS